VSQEHLFTLMLQECYKSVTRVLQGCYNSVTRVLQECYKSVTRVLQVCYKSVTRVLQECYKSVTRVLQECYKSVTRVLHTSLAQAAAQVASVTVVSLSLLSCTYMPVLHSPLPSLMKPACGGIAVHTPESMENMLEEGDVLQSCPCACALLCCESVTKVLQECYKSVTKVLQGCYKSVTRGKHLGSERRRA
jgi:hypothetical protein